MISTSEQRAEHPLAGRNTQHLTLFLDVRKRLDVCPDHQYMDRSFCFYESEWPCGGRCIPKSEVCPEINNEGCDAGMMRCGRDRCVDRNTPCNGKCWSDTATFICGSNMCLSKYQLEVRYFWKNTFWSPDFIFLRSWIMRISRTP